MASLVQIWWETFDEVEGASCFSYPIRDPFPGLFDKSLVHSQYPILLSGLQSSLHLLPPHLQLDTQTLEQLRRKKKSVQNPSLVDVQKYSSDSIQISEQVLSVGVTPTSCRYLIRPS